MNNAGIQESDKKGSAYIKFTQIHNLKLGQDFVCVYARVHQQTRSKNARFVHEEWVRGCILKLVPFLSFYL